MSIARKILVPVDFSCCSKQALEHAIELAERFGSSIDVLHVWGPAAGSGASDEPIARVKAINEMEALLTSADHRHVTSIQRLHESGEPVPMILEVARRGAYDLIVMGTHGRVGMAHDYLGSVAEKIVRRAPCPVLTFREKRPESVDSAPAASVAAMAPTLRGR